MVVLFRFTKIPRSILIRLAVFIIVWGNFTGLCFMNKYSIEEKCKTVSELNDKDRKQIAEDIIKHNKIVNLSFLGLAKVDTNKYPDLFPDTEITSSEAECKVLGKGRRSILPYFFALSCVLSLILFGGIIMEGEPL
ncbi:hypothetical protein [Treponema sp. OMZ 855]|uniref:hypothetical protein n=1 Tax=Treponema sp. OMZ 855 TaxID=1643512 RepID=UPI0020A2CF02|nr:hypothetical protein [Treponema sp. OMZ 855]